MDIETACVQDVLDLLKEKRPNPVTASDIFAAKGIEVSELPELQQQLREHSNIDQTPSGGYVFKVHDSHCLPVFLACFPVMDMP